MSLVFASITPHSPLFIKEISKDNYRLTKKTIKSFGQMSQSLTQAEPETIIIISPHGIVQNNAFTINLNPEFDLSLQEFGDFTERYQPSGDVMLAHRIKENLETKASLQMVSAKKLDHGISVPLILLASQLPKTKIIPLYYSNLNLEEHFKFGLLLQREIIYSKTRIAVIASGDLSHRLSRSSPAGYSAKAKKFDKRVMDALLDRQGKSLIDIDQETITNATECGLRSIAILMGILDNIKHEPELLSYEHPYGIGYMTMNFKL